MLLNTVFVSDKNIITFQLQIKTIFNSLSVNLVLFAVIMVAHCIQKYEMKKYEQKNFDDFRVLNKFCVDDELKKESY